MVLMVLLVPLKAQAEKDGFSFGMSGGYGKQWSTTRITGEVAFTDWTLTLNEMRNILGLEIPEGDLSTEGHWARYPALEFHSVKPNRADVEVVIPIGNIIANMFQQTYGFDLEIFGGYSIGSEKIKFFCSPGTSFGFKWKKEERNNFHMDLTGFHLLGGLRMGPEFVLGYSRIRLMVQGMMGYAFSSAKGQGRIDSSDGPVPFTMHFKGHSFTYRVLGGLIVLINL